MMRVGLLRAAAGVLAVLLVAGCGDSGGPASDASGGDVGDSEAPINVPAEVVVLTAQPRSAPGSLADPAVAAEAISAFGFDLFRAVAAGAGPDANVIVSPASVAIALAMLEPGATGEARSQLRDLLRVEDPDAFHASMNALEQSLEARVAEALNDNEKPGELVARIVNAAYLQQGYPFEPAYLERIGTHYGPVLRAVDFRADPDAVASEMNRFVAEATSGRIKDLVGKGVLKPETVLALVNALYLKASWLATFDKAKTEDETFTRLDGATLSVPMMRGFSASSTRGDGWVAATKPYVGRLSVQFILPDEGRFGDVAANLAGILGDFDRRSSKGAELALPRFETRFGAEISDPLRSLGLTAPYEQGNLRGVADDPRLVLDRAIHQTFLAMDEDGTEAAAATILVVEATSAAPSKPVPVILDRPFLFRIFDQETGATLFLGRILDPTT